MKLLQFLLQIGNLKLQLMCFRMLYRISTMRLLDNICQRRLQSVTQIRTIFVRVWRILFHFRLFALALLLGFVGVKLVYDPTQFLDLPLHMLYLIFILLPFLSLLLPYLFQLFVDIIRLYFGLLYWAWLRQWQVIILVLLLFLYRLRTFLTRIVVYYLSLQWSQILLDRIQFILKTLHRWFDFTHILTILFVIVFERCSLRLLSWILYREGQGCSWTLHVYRFLSAVEIGMQLLIIRQRAVHLLSDGVLDQCQFGLYVNDPLFKVPIASLSGTLPQSQSALGLRQHQIIFFPFLLLSINSFGH